MTYTHKNGMIYDTEDGQTIAAMSESATPQQAELLAAAPSLLVLCERAFRALHWDDFPQLKDDIKEAIERATL